MMNPQYMPPGQNNNAPSNPLGYPPSTQEFNGHQNANVYGQMPPSGPASVPPKPHDQGDMSRKLQNMNLSGGPGFPQIPPGQLPPGANNPNYAVGPGQPPNQNYQPRPPIGAPPQSQYPQNQNKPQTPPQPASTPGLNPSQPGNPLQTQSMPLNDQNRFAPASNASQPSHLPPGQTSQLQNVRPQQPPKPNQLPSGLPQPAQPHLGHPAQPPMGQPLGQPHMGQPPQPGQPPMGQPSQPGQPPMGQPPQPGQPPMGQPSQPGHPPMGQPPQPGQPHMGQPPRPGQPPMGQPPQPGQPPMGQPAQPGPLLVGQPPQPTQPHMGPPPQPGQPQMGQPGPPHMGQAPQPGQPQMVQPRQPPMGQPLQPGQPQMAQPRQLSMGQPPQQGQPQMAQPGLPHMGQPQPGSPHVGPLQPPGPRQPGAPQGVPGYQQPQPGTLAGMPHMPPPLSQQGRQYQGMPPPAQQPGYAIPPGPPTSAAYPGMQPMAGQPMANQPPMPGQHQQIPGQPPMPAQYPQNYPGQPGQFPGAQPPFPAQQPSYAGQQYPGYQAPQQPMKRLDPDQMPSPIQVMTDDQQSRGGIFVTNERGLVPPLVTTDFVVDDKGNSSPRYIRSSMYSVPVTADVLKQTSMPFCLVISPMAETVGTEQEPPLLDFAALTNSPTMGPVRCCRCKAYMCPNMKFLDAGRHFKCAFCKATTEVPMEYTQYVNSMQQYGRMPAEMALGTYEIIATKEYCRNNTLPNPPAIVFVIDVSYNSMKSGLASVICQNVADIIDNIPKDPATGQKHTRVGFITYSSTVHFYNIKGTLAQPQMLSVGDVSDMFVPLLEGFLVTPEDSGLVLEALLQQIPTMFADNKETEIILLPAVQAGLEALKAADTSGQLLVFHTSLPTFPAPGKLTNREDRKLLGTEKEKQILAPQSTVYNELGQSCSAAGVAVELFVANNAYVDAATIGQLPRLTGGQMHKYTYFTAEMDGPRLIEDVIRVVSRPTAFDAVMRVRTSTGVRATEFLGHLFMSNTTDVELAVCDADKAIGVEVKHDDKLTSEEGVYIQAALLYTHRTGQRRLRVLNLALNVAHQLADVYRSCELDTLVNFLTKQAVWALRENTPRQVREGLSSRCAKSLAAYRRHCASPSSAGQLVLPEAMKLLPLYTNCVLRSDAVAGGPDLTCDDRSWAMYRALTADVATSVVYTYPRLLPLHRLPEPLAAGAPPSALPPLRASIDKMDDQGVYLLENGVHMLLWVGSQSSPEFLQDVFGVTSPQQIDTQVGELPPLDNALSEAARACVDEARTRRHRHMRLTIVHQYDKEAVSFRRMLLEDRGIDGAPSYVEHLMQTHSEIKKLV